MQGRTVSRYAKAENFFNYDKVIILSVQNKRYQKVGMMDLTTHLDSQIDVFKDGLRGLDLDTLKVKWFSDLTKDEFKTMFRSTNAKLISNW